MEKIGTYKCDVTTTKCHKMSASGIKSAKWIDNPTYNGVRDFSSGLKFPVSQLYFWKQIIYFVVTNLSKRIMYFFLENHDFILKIYRIHVQKAKLIHKSVNQSINQVKTA